MKTLRAFKKNLRIWWRQFRCTHSRRVQFFPGEVDCIVPSGSIVKHQTVVIEGCLNCGKTMVRDYGE